MTTTEQAMTRAIIQDGYGPPERVLRIDDRVTRPPTGADDVLVRVRATSVNTPDWATVVGEPRIFRLRSGLRRPKQPVRGSDVAGIVEAVGSRVTDFQPGEAVFGSLWGSDGSQAGTFAHHAVVPATQLVRKPDGLGFDEAAASVMVGLTALIAMRDVGKVRPGTRVLINGASGGVGTMAVQIARSLGAEVTGVCGPRNVDLVRSLGAHHVIDYTAHEFTDGSERYDVILDNVLNHPPKAVARLLAPGGVFIPNSLGNTGGLLAGLPRVARAMVMGKGRRTKVGFVSVTVRRDDLNALVRLLESGEIRVVLDRTYPFEEAASAIGHVLAHHASGKVAILM